MRGRRRRGVSRRRTVKKGPRRRSGRKLKMDLGVAQALINRRGNNNISYRYFPQTELWGRRGLVRTAGDVGYSSLIAGGMYAAGRLRMDTPSTSSGRVIRGGRLMTLPYGSQSQGRVHKKTKRRVSFSSRTSNLTTRTGVAQMTRSYARYKKPINVKKALSKLDIKDTYNVGLVWQRIAPLNAAQASLLLKNDNSSDTNRLPVHVYRIDDRLDLALNTNSTHAMAYELLTGDTFNNVGFSNILGDSMTNTLQNRTSWDLLWATNTTNAGSEQVRNWDHTVLRHVKVDIMMRGVRTRPTTFKVQFVQFKREAIAPEHNWTPGNAQDLERTRFWTQFAKPLVAHPLANNPRDFHAGEYMRVLKTYYKKFQPDSADNLDVTALQHRMTIKLNLNRYCDYTAVSTLPGGQAELWDNEPETLIETSSKNDNAHVGSWKARVYMIISATVNAGSTTEVDLYPQYDISIRPVHTLKDTYTP